MNDNYQSINSKATRMLNLPKIKSTLGNSYNVRGDDVVAVKTGLTATGHYRMPSYGMTPHPDTELFDAIKRFQNDNGLRVDGIMTPEGPTERALRARLDAETGATIAYHVNTVAIENSIVAVRYAVAMEAVVFGRGGPDSGDEYGLSE